LARTSLFVTSACLLTTAMVIGTRDVVLHLTSLRDSRF